jgi:phosphatidyl-myo-inositol dimannoside synthase
MLITEVFPPQTGGSGRWLWEIYRRLTCSQLTIAAGAQTDDRVFDQSHRLDVHRLPMSFPTWGVAGRNGLASYCSLVGSLSSLVRRYNPDQIHTGKVLPEGLAAWCLNKRFGKPYLVYVHGEELNISARSRELRFLTKWVLRRARKVIANSHNTAELLKQDWGATHHQIEVMHPGVDIERYRPSDQTRLRSELGWQDRTVIITVGRLQKRKGQDQLIRCLPAIRHEYPNILYSIVGDGSEKPALEGLVKELDIADCVEFRGEVSDDEMLKCYQHSDIFVLPNRTIDGDFEGFGMVLLEAQACGKPVITGTSGGTGEAMMDGTTGLRVNCDSVPELTKAINRLLGDKEVRDRMGATGRDWTCSKFSWEALVKQAGSVFESCTPSGMNS